MIYMQTADSDRDTKVADHRRGECRWLIAGQQLVEMVLNHLVDRSTKGGARRGGRFRQAHDIARVVTQRATTESGDLAEADVVPTANASRALRDCLAVVITPDLPRPLPLIATLSSSIRWLASVIVSSASSRMSNRSSSRPTRSSTGAKLVVIATCSGRLLAASSASADSHARLRGARRLSYLGSHQATVRPPLA